MNKEKIKVIQKKHYQKNKEKYKVKSAEYYQKKKDRLAAKTPCPHCGKLMRKSSILGHIRESCKKAPATKSK